ncbi:MAG: hypothetical protein HZC49_08075 [Nitrospirae bacterium]|nr:hypothetical protein [Nitrospirota bacterium]
MRQVLFISILLSLLIMTACSPRISRHGYEFDPSRQKEQCDVAMTQFREFSKDEVEVLAEVDVGDTGFTRTCEETDILNILKNEGCMMAAHVVNITKEKRPDWWSTCYRASAEFLRVKDNPAKEKIRTDPAYDEPTIARRVEEDKRRNRTNILGAIFTGMMAGLAIILL